MRKILFLNILFVFFGLANAQQDFRETDSISYALFYEGKWDELIKFGDAAIAVNIDFKWLRQRMGYAWYMKGNYFNAIKHYEKAYKFDQTDETTNAYLYYSGLNTANQAYARYFAQNLSNETKNYLNIKAFKPLDAIDFEYNRKFNNYILRSDANYYRAGLNSQIGYKLNLYQMFAGFNQEIDYGTTQLKQNEYYALLTYTAAPKTLLSGGYHYIKTDIKEETANNTYPGNLFFGKIQQHVHRFDFSLSASVYSNEFGNVIQTGTQFGVALPGRITPYLKSSVFYMNDYGNKRLIFQQTASALVLKKLWAETNVTFGYLNNFTDMNGMYFYNSVDPTTFRTGISFYGYISKNIILFTNYTFNRKEVTETLSGYNQHSITGGFIWKL